MKLAESNQEMFETFLRRCDGKGRAMRTRKAKPICCYVPDDPNHCGCAIGCQITDPDLRAKIKAWERNPNSIMLGVESLCGQFDLSVPNTNFAQELQRFHDRGKNWDGLNLNRNRVEAFAREHELTIPDDWRKPE
jgi:hypothetical protein